MVRFNKCKIYISYLLAAVLILSIFFEPAFAAVANAANEVPNKIIYNDFVEITVNGSTGRFSIRTREGSPLRDKDENKFLLFQRDVPETSFTTFRIDGEDYIYGNRYGFLGLDGIFKTTPYSQQLTNQSTWVIKGLEITQTLQLIGDPTNPQVGNVKVTYTVKNPTNRHVSIGARILLDTMLGENDASPITFSGQNTFIHKETEVEGGNIPYYWRAADDPIAPRVISYGFLEGWGNKRPDKLILAHWEGISRTKWDYIVNSEMDFTSDRNIYGSADSAVALYWNPVSLSPGKEIVFETYYGLGNLNLRQEKAKYGLQVFAPQKLTVNEKKDGYVEEEFEISAEIDNGRETGQYLSDAKVTLGLPEQLELVEGQSAVQTIPFIGPGELRTVTWRVRPKPQSSYKVAQFNVSVQAEGFQEMIMANYVIMPALTGQPPKVQIMNIVPGKVYLYEPVKTIRVNGTGFDLLKVEPGWRVTLVRTRDEKTWLIPMENINIASDKSMDIILDDSAFEEWDKLDEGQYTLVIDAKTYGILSKDLEFTTKKEYQSRNYGILVIEGHEDKTKDKYVYSIVTVENENMLAQLKKQYENLEKTVLLEFRGKVKEIPGDNGSVYEISPGSTINSVIRFDTSEMMISTYGEASQKITISKNQKDLLHTDDYIEIAGNGILSIPNFPFVRGEFSIELVDGNEYSLDADEEEDQLPIEIEWEVLKSLSIIQRISFFPVEIENAIIGDRSVSFRGTLNLNLGGKQDEEDDKNGGGSGGGDNEDDDDDDDDESAGFGVSVKEARFGLDDKDKFGFIGLKAEGEIGLPKDFVPGMNVGAKGKVAIDTIEHIYEIEAEVKFEVIELYGLFTLRFLDGGIPIPDNFLFVVGGKPGIPLIPPVVIAYITKGGGGFKNLYDTVVGNYNILPPLKLVLVGGISIAQVVEGDDITLEMSARGIEFSGKLKILKFEILKEFYGYILFKDSLDDFGISIRAGAKLEIFDIIKGEAYVFFEYDQSKKGIFGPVAFGGGAKAAIEIPEKVPLVGGKELLSAEVELSTEKVYAGIAIIGIPVSIEYVWGESLPTFRVGMETAMAGAGGGIPPGLQFIDALAVEDYVNDETGEFEGRFVYGSNIKRVASSADKVKKTRPKGPAYLAMAGEKGLYGDLQWMDPAQPIILASSDSTEHIINIQDQEIALLEFMYEGEEVPNIQVYDPEGNPYELTEDVNYLVQVIPAKESDSGVVERRIFVSIQNPINGNWRVVSDKPIISTLMDVTVPPSLKNVTVQQDEDNDHVVTVNWEVDHIRAGDKIGLYLCNDKENDAGRKLVDEIDAASGSITYTLPDSVASGKYYIRAVLYNEGTNYPGMYSMESITVIDPHQPEPPTNIQVTPVGNGLFDVKWDKSSDAEGYYIQLLDGNKNPLGNTGPAKVEGNVDQTLVGGVFEVEKDGKKELVGMVPGSSYVVSMTAYKTVEGATHFSETVYSDIVYLPEPDPAELTFELSSAGGQVKEKADADGSKYYLVNKDKVSVKVVSDQHVQAEVYVNDVLHANFNGSSWQGEILLEEGKNAITVYAVNENGDLSTAGITIVSDTVAPELKIESPAPGITVYSVIPVRGVADVDSIVSVNGNVVQLDSEGLFDVELPMGNYMEREVVVEAVDEAGNKTEYRAIVAKDLVSTFDRVEIRQADENDTGSGGMNMFLAQSSARFEIEPGDTLALSLFGIDENGIAHLIDNRYVEWSIMAGENLGTISPDGVLEAKGEGEIVVKAAFSVSEEYAFEDAVLIKVGEIAATPGVDESSGYGPTPVIEDDEDEDYEDDSGRDTTKDEDKEEGEGEDEGEGETDEDLPGDGDAPGEQDTGTSPIDEELERMLRYLVEQELGVSYLNSAVIDGNEDTVIQGDDNISITVPAQALGAKIGISIGKVENTSGYDNKNIKVYGGIYEIKTDTEVRFNKAVTLTLKYDEAWLEPGQDINDIKIYWYNERTGSWEYLGGVLDKANKTISITLKHLSKYTLGFDEKMLQMKDMPGRWSYDIVNRLISIGVVNGVKMEDGYYYYPERPITRQEFAKLIVLASGVPLADRSEANYFADVSQIGDWAVPYIATATKRQWLKGVPEAAGMSVHPLRNITRAEAATVIGRIIEEAGIESESLTQSVFTDLNDVPDWALKYVNLLNMHEIILGYPDGTFRPNNFINREEAAAIIARMLDLFHATGKYLD